MRKFQPIAAMIITVFLVVGGMAVAYGQQSNGPSTPPANANMQPKSSITAQPNVTASTEHKNVNDGDKQFVTSALKSGMFEIALSKQAATKSANKEVISLANDIIRGHSNANDQLSKIAQNDGLQIPMNMGDRHESMLQKFSKLNGTKFDDAYMKAVINSHQMAIDRFTAEAKQGGNQDLKSFAAQTLPTLQHHLSRAESVNHKIASQKVPWWEFWKRV